MKNQPESIGNQNPVSIPSKPQSKPQPIRYWQRLYEGFLSLNAKKSTFRRYARALEKFLSKHPEKTYGYDFLRPVIIDYVESRLAEGASVATVRVELSAVRGLFDFMLAMNAYDVMINPAKNVTVPEPKDQVLQNQTAPSCSTAPLDLRE